MWIYVSVSDKDGPFAFISGDSKAVSDEDGHKFGVEGRVGKK